MKMPILRFTALFTAISLLFVFSILALSGQLDDLAASILAKDLPSVKEVTKKYTVILDAGHGGEDGGASGQNGTLEKDLNLQLVKRLESLLSVCGFEVLLTREKDELLGNGEKGHKKLADLSYRLDFANEHPDALLLSVHMNKFPDGSCRGIQLYYSGNNEKSLSFGQALHKNVKEFQKDNKRELKKAGSNIYLLDRVKIPAALIECGFLSNNEESLLLQDENYQKQLSLLILSSLDGYFKSNEKSA